ncbi:MAG TPA: HlyD family efflux transporter periplasmic adaptor subunit [bacterium]|nr:HlyD family efflux transporter periplasmic adaptor subunit [bacterium]HPN45862.1 HlyD family efflux transporter periplasmic adaptor subunit [bacterium]
MDRIIQKKKWPPRKIVLFSVSGVLVILVLYNLILGDHRSKLNVESERITISEVTRDVFQEFIPVTGTVIPITTVYLDAIEGGRVEKKYLEAGTFVKKGDSILTLANTDLLMNIMYREAELFEQSNNLRNTRLAMDQHRLDLKAQLISLDYEIKQQKRAWERAQELYERKLISLKEYEDVRDKYEYLQSKSEITLQTHKQDSLFRIVQIEQLESSLARMQDNLKIVRKNMQDLTLKAPITGQLTSLNAEIGESKNRGERLGQIDVLDGFKIRVQVDEHYIARIQLGQTGEFTFAGQTCKLLIKKIFPEVIEGRFEVDMEFAEKEPDGIRRGQTVHIRLALGDLSEALLLATGGFFNSTGGQWVYVVDDNGKAAHKRNIRIGRQNTQNYEVLEGLKPGEKVITSSYDNYGDIEVLLLK